jgi:hypothetical protein
MRPFELYRIFSVAYARSLADAWKVHGLRLRIGIFVLKAEKLEDHGVDEECVSCLYWDLGPLSPRAVCHSKDLYGLSLERID